MNGSVHFAAKAVGRVFCAALLCAMLLECGGGSGSNGGVVNETTSLIVISPHQDDETIMAGGTLYRASHDGQTRIEIIYVTAGDAAGCPGACMEESEEAKKRKITELREEETRAACGVLGVDPSHLHFLRYPDQELVEETWFSAGRRVDVLTGAGEQAVAHVVDLLPTLVPPDARSLTVIAPSFWDAHADHRVSYRAARAAAEVVRIKRGIPVRILHSIVHDEVPCVIAFCCLGDLHWPNPEPHMDHAALVDFPLRPRPPFWDVVHELTEDLVAARTEALNKHVSQVQGWPELCMIVFYKKYYYYWMEKTEEVFYEEVLQGPEGTPGQGGW